MFSILFPLFTLIHHLYTPSCIGGLDLINLRFQINNHQTLANCQPRSWNIQPCLRHVGTGTQSWRTWDSRINACGAFYWLLEIIPFFPSFRKELAIENWSKQKGPLRNSTVCPLFVCVTKSTRRFMKHLWSFIFMSWILPFLPGSSFRHACDELIILIRGLRSYLNVRSTPVGSVSCFLMRRPFFRKSRISFLENELFKKKDHTLSTKKLELESPRMLHKLLSQHILHKNDPLRPQSNRACSETENLLCGCGIAESM